MLVVLASFAVAAVVVPTLVHVLGTRAFAVAALVPAAAFVLALVQTPRVFAGGVSTVVPWIPELGIDLAFRLDPLSWVLTLVVTGVGALVLLYCVRYFADGEPALARFAGVFVAFAGSMYGLVVADDVFLLFVFWEGTTVFSYLLIGHDPARRAARVAAMQALVVTTFGGLAMLAGLVLLSVRAGTGRLSGIVAAAEDGHLSGALVTVAVLLVLAGALSKSAIVPFHFWLPSAMAAPTPVSAYLHAAAMVKAGIYLVARLAPGFAEVPGWRGTIVVLGITGMLVGGVLALRQTDLKLLLAYGTVAQLGFLVTAAGWGSEAVAIGAIVLLLGHACFKATLFLTVGAIDHATGTRDLRRLSGLGRRAPVLAVIALLALASMSGLPPTIGFVGKEALLTGLLDATAGPSSAWAWVALVGVVIGSVLTVAYSVRFFWGAFWSRPGVPATHPHDLRPLLPVPGLLAVAGLVLGAAIAAVGQFLEPVGHGLSADGEVAHLALWHGLEPALALSAVTLVGGAALVAGLARLRTRAATVGVVPRLPVMSGRATAPSRPSLPTASGTYRAAMRGLDRGAALVTANVQRGSLPYYLTVILSVMVAAAVANLVLGGPWAVHLRFQDSWAQLPTVVVMAVAAIGVLTARTRFAAALLVGVTGYGMSVLFVVQGAYDLALTQLVVETVTLVAFVLVLRRLPPRIAEANPSRFRVGRALFAAACGLVLAVVVVVVASSRTADPIWTEIPALTSSFGHGQNVVNVALVDLRGWDTMGELSVVVAAATGVASLVFVKSREDTLPRLRGNRSRVGDQAGATAAGERDRDGGGPRVWLPTSDALPTGRSALLDVVVRLLFHGMVVLSVYLLFAGHNLIGGGFAGGLVAGIALVGRYLAGGAAELGAAAPVRAGRLLGLGLATAATTAVVPLFAGQDALESTFLEATVPVLGHVEFVTATFFDVGVYLIVVGLVLDVLRSLGAEVDRQGRAERRGAGAPATERSAP
ncbi:Na+/H+ antiporter subunit A [Curtobacterium sp. RRHDQ10]|uniref:Na+/H+ antiporter subunit A n=1 Tax=Curtobacterium phyllosphaerae TaxID=3413379 RepID=UPI003BF2FE89